MTRATESYLLGNLQSDSVEDAYVWTTLPIRNGISPINRTVAQVPTGIWQTVSSYVLWIKKFVLVLETPDESSTVAANQCRMRHESVSWIIEKACTWLYICHHLKSNRLTESHHLKSNRLTESYRDQALRGSHAVDVDKVAKEQQSTENATFGDPIADSHELPGYVLDYAPLVYLFSGEKFWPCDMTDHLTHTTPSLNYTPIQSIHPTLDNLYQLNRWGPRWVFLTSNDNVEENPEWLEGAKNIPAENSTKGTAEDENWAYNSGRTYLKAFEDAIDNLNERSSSESSTAESTADLHHSRQDDPSHQAHLKVEEHFRSDSERHKVHGHQALGNVQGGRSDAPAVLIVVDKGNGIVDAFWFFFYSFNLGNSVFNIRFGNHVGDWEHSAVRFLNGQPQAVYFSEHSFGSAYSYEAVEKLGKRPVIYSAVGTHAMYPTAGKHPYVLPFGILHDETDRGPLWDPVLNSYTYLYNHKADILRPSAATPDAPLGWFYYAGRWGDREYPLGDRRQYRFAGQSHYVSGPLGPRFKNLGRNRICPGPDSVPCVIKNWLNSGSGSVTRWKDLADADEQTKYQTSD